MKIETIKKEAMNYAGVNIIDIKYIDEYRFSHQAYGFKALVEKNGKQKWISNCISNQLGQRWRSNSTFFVRCKKWAKTI